MDVRRAVPIAVGLTLVVLALAACAPTSNQGGGTTGGGGTATSTAGGLTPQQVGGIISDWTKSPHANVVLLPTTIPGCVRCHDGGAFAEGITDPAQIKRNVGPETSATSFPVATDCRACHTGQGADYIKSGQVGIPSKSTSVTAGAGAVCMACHNQRTAANPNDPQHGAPHVGPQADVLVASGGMQVGVIHPGSLQKHATVKDTCVHCHMADVNGVPTHTFAVQNTAPCKQCHPQASGTDFNFPAKADYDGNGKVEGLQTEVKGLLTTVTAAAEAQMQGGKFMEQAGRIVFKKDDTTVTPMPEKVYVAAYNIALIENDKSMGVHNPRFVVDLLQQSYQELTGKPIPGAQPYPGSSTSTSGAGSQTGTPSAGGTGTPSTGTTP